MEVTFKCFPARCLRGSHRFVEVLTVKDPSRIYVHLEDPEGHRGMLLKYIAETSPTHPEVHPMLEEEAYEGAPVLVRCDNRYYRGVVERERDEEGDVLVWLGDWAVTLITNLEEMHTVPRAYRSVPFQAVACGMHGTRPSGPGGWGVTATDLLKGILEEGSTWRMEIRDRDTGSDAIWVDFVAEEEGVASPREKMIGTGMAVNGRNPGWFDWGEDASFFCDRAQLPHHYRECRGPGHEISSSEEEHWVDPRDIMEEEEGEDENTEMEDSEDDDCPEEEVEGWGRIRENGRPGELTGITSPDSETEIESDGSCM